jgi:hypothetical protein
MRVCYCNGDQAKRLELRHNTVRDEALITKAMRLGGLLEWHLQ